MIKNIGKPQKKSIKPQIFEKMYTNILCGCVKCL